MLYHNCTDESLLRTDRWTTHPAECRRLRNSTGHCQREKEKDERAREKRKLTPTRNRSARHSDIEKRQRRSAGPTLSSQPLVLLESMIFFFSSLIQRNSSLSSCRSHAFLLFILYLVPKPWIPLLAGFIDATSSTEIVRARARQSQLPNVCADNEMKSPSLSLELLSTSISIREIPPTYCLNRTTLPRIVNTKRE